MDYGYIFTLARKRIQRRLLDESSSDEPVKGAENAEPGSKIAVNDVPPMRYDKDRTELGATGMPWLTATFVHRPRLLDLRRRMSRPRS
jgi:hypothetical protein